MKKLGVWLIVLLCAVASFGGAARAAEAAKELPRPLFLVPGWGPPAIIGYRSFRGFLEDDGFPPERIHVLRYDYTKDLAHITRQLIAQFRVALAKYPADTRFDVIGHSTGDFVALYALIEAGLAQRIDHYVGLSGIGHGWDCPACKRGWLGKTERTLSPAYNDFITDFYRRNDAIIAPLRKCALFSPDDGLIAPYDSGRFEDGINVEVRGMRHLDSVKERRYYELMRSSCFEGSMIP